MRTFETTQGDYGRPLLVDLAYEDTALDLTQQIDVTTPIVMHMRPRPTGPAVFTDAAVTIVSRTAKTVRVSYTFIPPQLDTPGTYEAEFEAALTGGEITGPSFGKVQIRIDPQIA